MDKLQKHTKPITFLGLSGLSVLLDIIGLAIPKWYLYGNAEEGLWEFCWTGDSCFSIPDDDVSKCGILSFFNKYLHYLHVLFKV